MIKEDFAGPPILRHVGVSHEPEAPGRPALPPPRLVVSTREGEHQRVEGVDYVRVRDFGEVSILRLAAQ